MWLFATTGQRTIIRIISTVLPRPMLHRPKAQTLATKSKIEITIAPRRFCCARKLCCSVIPIRKVKVQISQLAAIALQSKGYFFIFFFSLRNVVICQTHAFTLSFLSFDSKSSNRKPRLKAKRKKLDTECQAYLYAPVNSNQCFGKRKRSNTISFHHDEPLPADRLMMLTDRTGTS